MIVFAKMVETSSHDFKDEVMEAKVKWFQSLTLEERMNVFVSFTRLILQNNPDILKRKYVRPASERISVIPKA